MSVLVETVAPGREAARPRPRLAVLHDWVVTVDHKRLGILYVLTGLGFLVVVWVVTGPLFGFSDTWQLVINTGTTIVTFLMVFLIQRTQNKDSIAVQLKLNELVAAMEGASHRLINVEDLSEEELTVLHAYYCRLAEVAKQQGDIRASHSIEEAEGNARAKRRNS